MAGRSWSPVVVEPVCHTVRPRDVVCSSGVAGPAGSVLLVSCEPGPPGGGGLVGVAWSSRPGCGRGRLSSGLRRSGVPVRLFVWFQLGLSLCVQGRIPPCGWLALPPRPVGSGSGVGFGLEVDTPSRWSGAAVLWPEAFRCSCSPVCVVSARSLPVCSGDVAPWDW